MGEADGYRLTPVRDARAREERIKQGDLAGAVGDAAVTQAKIDAAAVRVERIRAAITRTREGTLSSTNASSLVLVERHLARLRRDLEAARDELARAEAAHRGSLDAVDAARTRLVRARADKELIERHFARWREDRRKLAERRED